MIESSDPNSEREADLALSLDPETSAAELDRLADSKDYFVRFNVARHANTSNETLKKLGSELGTGADLALSLDPETSTARLDRLADSKDPFVRVNVARHANTSNETLEKLSREFGHGSDQAPKESGDFELGH